MSEHAVLHALPAVTLDTASPKQHALLADAQRQIGFIPAMYANMAHAPGLLETYLEGYQRVREESPFTPVEQEVIFLELSVINGCQYCTAAHSMLADKVSGVSEKVWRAIRAGETIPDARLAALQALTRSLAGNHGRACPEAFGAYLKAGYPETGLLYIILAAAVKTLSNFSNHAFATQIDPAFAAYALTTQEHYS